MSQRRTGLPPFPTSDDPGYVRPGWTTSEFWGATFFSLIALVTLFDAHLAEQLSSWAQPLALTVSGLAWFGYALARAIVKARAHDAVAKVAVARLQLEASRRR